MEWGRRESWWQWLRKTRQQQWLDLYSGPTRALHVDHSYQSASEAPDDARHQSMLLLRKMEMEEEEEKKVKVLKEVSSLVGQNRDTL